MTIKLRKAEIAELVKLAETDEHESPEDFVQAIVKLADELRGQRTTWTAVFRHHEGNHCFFTAVGPHSTRGQAAKTVEKVGKLMHTTGWALASTRTIENLEQLVAEIDAAPAPKGDFAIVKEDARAFKAGAKNRAGFARNRGAW